VQNPRLTNSEEQNKQGKGERRGRCGATFVATLLIMCLCGFFEYRYTHALWNGTTAVLYYLVGMHTFSRTRFDKLTRFVTLCESPLYLLFLNPQEPVAAQDGSCTLSYRHQLFT